MEMFFVFMKCLQMLAICSQNWSVYLTKLTRTNLFFSIFEGAVKPGTTNTFSQKRTDRFVPSLPTTTEHDPAFQRGVLVRVTVHHGGWGDICVSLARGPAPGQSAWG